VSGLEAFVLFWEFACVAGFVIALIIDTPRKRV
jgi:hypothetical protein